MTLITADTFKGVLSFSVGYLVVLWWFKWPVFQSFLLQDNLRWSWWNLISRSLLRYYYTFVVDHLALLFGDSKCLCNEIQSNFKTLKYLSVWTVVCGYWRACAYMAAAWREKHTAWWVVGNKIGRCVYFFTGIFLPQKRD